MAIVYATKSGNWSDTTVWDTGALPTEADDVRSNTYTVVIDVSDTVLSVSNKVDSPAAAGGSFTLANGVTLTVTAAQGVIGGVASTGSVNVTFDSPGSATIIGHIAAGATANFWGVYKTGTGTLNVTGNVTGGAGTSANGVVQTAAGTLNVTGNVTAGAGTTAYGVFQTAAGTVTIIGNVAAGAVTSANGVVQTAAGTITVTGNVTGGAGTSAHGVFQTAAGTITVTGNVTAGAGNSAHGVFQTAAGTVTIIGSLTANLTANGFASNQGSNTAQLVKLTGPFIDHENGISAVWCANWRWKGDPATYWKVRDETVTTYKTMYTIDYIDETDFPAAANVRLGTTYGPDSDVTGTAAIPPAGAVSLGVPVDAAVGTLEVSAAKIYRAGR
jgi:hypothetical protein